MSATALYYEDIVVGATYEFERTITASDVEQFAELTGDRNPLHVDESFARQSPFGQRIVHGMLAASLFSTLVGMHCPGERALFLGQTLQFRKPIFPGDTVVVRGMVIGKSDAAQMITIRTEILRAGDALVTGEATAKVLA